MCNLYANTTPQAAMRTLFDVAPEDDRLGNLAPLRAIFPRHDAPVVRVGQGGGRELISAHWGFVLPQASKRTGEPIQPKAVNNARDDKLRPRASGGRASRRGAASCRLRASRRPKDAAPR